MADDNELFVCRTTKEILGPPAEGMSTWRHQDGTSCGHTTVAMKTTWSVYHTGGGCLALILVESERHYWLLTDFEGPDLPVVGKPAALTRYDEVEETQTGAWRIERFTTPEDALAMKGQRIQGEW